MSKEIGENLIRLRKQKNKFQKEVAEGVGAKHGTYTSWERGLANPGVESLIKLSKYFGVLVDDLVCNDSWNRVEDGLPEHNDELHSLKLWVCMDFHGSKTGAPAELMSDGHIWVDGADVTEFITHYRFQPQLPK
jgi:transcriptional regulator with XRE-family HTH domain